MIKLQRIGHILLNVRCRIVERSKRSTRISSGSRCSSRTRSTAACSSRSGSHGNTLDLFPSSDPDAYPQPKPGASRRAGLGVKHMAFAVATEEELKNAYFALKDAGVPIHRAIDHTSQKSIYFYDPDDNLLEIVWERPNVQEIFMQGRSDNDTPITFERPAHRRSNEQATAVRKRP